MTRLQELNVWLGNIFDSHEYDIVPASADASFRRYFRIGLDGQTMIAMDAPPPQENCAPFVQVAEVLLKAGLNVPRVIEQDLDQGFLLLSDLGDTTYLSALNENTAADLYSDASNALVKLQLASRQGVFPLYDEALLHREMMLLPDWYIAKHLGADLTDAQRSVLDKTFALLSRNILSQGKVYVHRDYHSRNLMVCDDNPGILDFQDAVYGPITYDLVSLLKDAYIVWDEDQVLDWTIRYWQSAKAAGLPIQEDFADFYRDFEWMGAQRHIKVLGIFARLYHRDGKGGYLKDMPLVMDYLRRVCARYVELIPLLRLLDQLENKQQQAGYTF
ncbi:aminoglycoside phosphotransferase [Methylovorus sp. MM2]|uniref:aminoglycoside phosphotransferase family protein n=1 Tax=Methylovorus sp. MM2 TaxID=1848038 RepID=UPI0007DE9D86|nr:aminoglycoside phosphotransferase [Methylovorus sp. MM2]